MTKNAYWDELGIAWCAVLTPHDVIVPRLKARLRGESYLMIFGMMGGLLLGVAAAGLGVFTLWSGWTHGTWNFVTRGAALMSVAAILIVASLALLPVMASDQARALPDMIDLTIARTERFLRAVRLGFVGCAVTAVLGSIGTAIRIYSSGPPALSPILDLAVLGGMGFGLFWYGRRLSRTRAKFRYLQAVLADSTDGMH
jgi:hypothetical protein